MRACQRGSTSDVDSDRSLGDARYTARPKRLGTVPCMALADCVWSFQYWYSPFHIRVQYPTSSTTPSTPLLKTHSRSTIAPLQNAMRVARRTQNMTACQSMLSSLRDKNRMMRTKTMLARSGFCLTWSTSGITWDLTPVAIALRGCR